ncbi:MAG: YjjG family noncanonical pyrimidine nucleotidase [Oscillospiraceae bacterium]
MRYTHLLFDLDGTLFDFQRAQRRAFFRTMADFSVLAGDELLARYDQINHDLWEALERREITRERLLPERFARLAAEGGFSYDPAQVNACYLRHLALGADLVEGAKETLDRLRGRVLLATASNGVGATQRRRLEDSGLLPYFSVLNISEEIGFEKPDPRFFARALQRCGDPAPRAVLLIGDSLSADIAGGIAAGLDTCWFNPGHLAAGTLAPTYTVDRLAALCDVAESSATHTVL